MRGVGWLVSEDDGRQCVQRRQVPQERAAARAARAVAVRISCQWGQGIVIAVAIALEFVEMRNACGFDWCGFCVARTHVRASYL